MTKAEQLIEEHLGEAKGASSIDKIAKTHLADKGKSTNWVELTYYFDDKEDAYDFQADLEVEFKKSLRIDMMKKGKGMEVTVFAPA